jgi:hypothetical protein
LEFLVREPIFYVFKSIEPNLILQLIQIARRLGQAILVEDIGLNYHPLNGDNDLSKKHKIHYQNFKVDSITSVGGIGLGPAIRKLIEWRTRFQSRHVFQTANIVCGQISKVSWGENWDREPIV